MKNSKWLGNRIGLLDFWYYDQQEFEFLDGRMLLRGANGSGKSVTMQSFIPLLLDGNIRPERLDPFGSKARKMENYLLEESDDRQERTGYLYMEFKREESDTYLTFGIGIRARKNKKLETWYFCITDGRRVGKDFLLYKELSEKIVLSKTELRNRIAEGGRVMETQGEYIHCVNELLFGFETVDEYKELLELLIQLRTPKLSKDFKPSIINEILSTSLQPLTEEDLRPMSEAIENMDAMETNLKTLEESLKAARDIEKVYDLYNKAVLFDKADSYVKAIKDYAKKDKEIRQLESDIEKDKANLSEQEERYQKLDNEHQVIEREFQVLKTSDAARWKEDENRLLEEEKQYQEEEQGNDNKIQLKTENRLEKENQEKEKSAQNELLWSEITDFLDELEECIESGNFDEWKYLAKELKETPDKKYDFEYHEHSLVEYMEKVREGATLLQEEASHRKRYDEILQDLDTQKEKREQMEREWKQYQRMLREEKDRWTENLYKWDKKNQYLLMQSEQMQDIVRKMEVYSYGDDYGEIKGIAREQMQLVEDELRRQRGKIQNDKDVLETEWNQLKEEIAQWESKEEAEPERTEEVKRNRKRLEELGISFLPLYKAIDFDDNISEEQKDKLEAALYHMGILDALIVDSEYREKILKLDGELCDKYLFGDIAGVQQSLIEIMHADHAENDIFLAHQVSTILSGISFQGEEGGQGTWIDKDGHYRIGVLEGNVSEGYQSRFIGTAARERHRMEIIHTLVLQKQELEEKMAVLEQEIASVSEKLDALKKEFEQFPQDTDVKEAAKDLVETERQIEGIQTEIARISERLEREREHLQEIQKQVSEVSTKTGLPGKLSVYQDMLKNLAQYGRILTKIQVAHNKYLDGMAFVATYRDEMEKLDEDLDALRYEKNRIHRRLDKCRQELQVVREQLSLTNYGEIQEKLDYYLKRLKEIPQEKEGIKEKEGILKTNIQTNRNNLEKETLDLLRRDQKRKKLREVFFTEHRLGYVIYDFVQSDIVEEIAEKVCGMLYGQLGSKTRYALLGDLQTVYHQNMGLLSEYQPTLHNLFEDMLGDAPGESIVGEGSITRLDIQAKYRGKNVSFKDLVIQLDEEREKLSILLSEKDRELFEDILSNTISKKIRAKIYESERWIQNMNVLMEAMQTSSGLRLSLKWNSRKSEKEDQLDTAALVDLLQRDAEIMRQEDIDKISTHFRSRIAEARKLSKEENTLQSFHVIMKEILDYRKWFEFQLNFQKEGERKRELTDRMFFTFSGGEKAMSMYVPLFSAVVAKYKGANEDAPKIISLDEAFAGVDEMNIKDMFRLMISLELNFIINSQVLWGDYDTVPGLAIYHLLRPMNAKSVTVLRYVWNGKEKILMTDEE